MQGCNGLFNPGHVNAAPVGRKVDKNSGSKGKMASFIVSRLTQTVFPEMPTLFSGSGKEGGCSGTSMQVPRTCRCFSSGIKVLK